MVKYSTKVNLIFHTRRNNILFNIFSGEGTLSAFHTKQKKLVLQSELMESEMLCVTLMKVDIMKLKF